MLRRCFRIENENGSMLVEGLIALALLLMIVSAMVPLFTLSSKSTANNKMQTIAYNAATEEIEHIKSLDYDDVGLVNGSPAGVLARDTDKTMQGLEFHVLINVKWVDDSSDGIATSGTDADGRDYKAVKVTFSWTGAFGHKELTLNTVVARESEETAVLGGNIIVTVRDPLGAPIENALVQITAGPSITNPITAYTDEHGEIIFYALTPSVSENDYTLTAAKTGFVGQPRLNPLPATVQLGTTTNISFTLDTPGRLTVRLVDTDTAEIATSSRITLQSGDMNAIDYTNASCGFFEITDLYPGVYQITPYAASYETTAPVSAQVNANQLTVITITLNRVAQQTANFIVSNSLGDAIQGAQIHLIDNTTTMTVDGTTNATGTCALQLSEHTFTVSVTKTDYYDYSGTIIVSSSGNNTFPITLSPVPPAPAKGGILVRTQKQSYNPGDPRNNVTVRVWSYYPSYYLEQSTGSYAAGEVLFDELTQGWYYVERWKSGQWKDGTWKEVTSGNTTNCTFTY